MPSCLLDGHVSAKRAGIGEYRGQEFNVCLRCGVTLDSEGRAMTKEQIEANRAINAAFERATRP
jgi:hypothetical protein